MSEAYLRELYPIRYPETHFMILAAHRSGGTYLAECLSNHPDVYCVRGEPFCSREIARTQIGIGRQIKLIFEQRWYRATGFKVAYSLGRKFVRRKVWTAIARYNVRIIHLIRQNIVAQALSMAHHEALRDYPKHAYDSPGKPPAVGLNPKAVIAYCHALHSGVERARQNIKQTRAKSIEVFYESISSDEGIICGAERDRLCNFLNVPRATLYSHLRKVHIYNYSEIISNWRAVANAIQEAGFGKHLPLS